LGRLSTNEVHNRDVSTSCYDYFKPVPGQEYKGQNVKRIHFCEKCRTESSITPYYFWNGRGCQNCSSKRGQAQQLDETEVLNRDNNALCAKSYPPDPDQEYVSQNKKRLHTCNECGHHGELIPKAYWLGTGCPKCGAKRGSANKIKNASKLAHDKDLKAKAYNTYPPISEYKGVGRYRLHRCKDCGHEGQMKPDNFWHNGRGCPKCGANKGSKNKRLNAAKLAPERDLKANAYELYPPITEYEGTFDHRLHRCSVCNYEGLMTPNNFWRGKGCPQCANKLPPNKDLVMQRDANTKHSKTYPPLPNQLTYNSNGLRIHECTECGYIGEMTFHSYWRGSGCPACANYGFDPGLPAVLYYLQVNTEEGHVLYKIGITNRTVEERFTKNELSLINVVKVWEFEEGHKAYEEEQRILFEYTDQRYKGEDVLTSGNTELFLYDVLKLANNLEKG